MFDFIGSRLASQLGKGDAAPLEDEKPVNPFPRGPVQFRSVTNGQIRRLQTRRAAAEKRKTNRRFRREWMRNERAFNTLRQQLVVVGLIQPRAEFPEALVDNVRRHLETSYGSIEKAQAYYVALVRERQAA